MKNLETPGKTGRVSRYEFGLCSDLSLLYVRLAGFVCAWIARHRHTDIMSVMSALSTIC